VYGKTYYDEAGAETFRVMSELWEGASGQSDPLWLAQPLRYQPELKLLWQRGLPGEPLLALGPTTFKFQARLEQAAAALAALHQTHIPAIPSKSIQDCAAALRSMRAWLPNVRPACQPALDQAVDALLGQVSALGEQPAATLHGDLHLQNIFCIGEQVALIDLDNVYRGSPWFDVGSFVAGLLYAGLTIGLPAARARELGAVFCAAYQRHVRWRISEWALDWYIATALINERAYRCVTRLKDGRLDLVDTLVAMAAQLSTGTALEEARVSADV
jgi:Ser/Thr protein kinase RdoA (MazF antagonist)